MDLRATCQRLLSCDAKVSHFYNYFRDDCYGKIHIAPNEDITWFTDHEFYKNKLSITAPCIGVADTIHIKRLNLFDLAHGKSTKNMECFVKTNYTLVPFVSYDLIVEIQPDGRAKVHWKSRPYH